MVGPSSRDVLSVAGKDAQSPSLQCSSPELAALLQDNHQDEHDFLQWMDAFLVNPHPQSNNHISQSTQSLPLGPTLEAEVNERSNINESRETNSEHQNFREFPVLESSNPTSYERVYGSTPRASLSWETISQHFYKPISRAAKELRISLTMLKKRCRELGFKRWPHQKLQSIQTAIRNVRNLGQTPDGEIDTRSREAITYLENWLKRIEEDPDLPLDPDLQKFRQSCIKGVYMKRRKRAEGTSTSSAPVVDQGNSMPEIVILSDSESDEDKDNEGVRGSRHISEFYP